MRIPKLVSSSNGFISMKSPATCNQKSMILSTSTICAYSSSTISPILEDIKGGVIVRTWYNHLNHKKVLKGFTSWIRSQAKTHDKLTWFLLVIFQNLTFFANTGVLIDTSGISFLLLLSMPFSLLLSSLSLSTSIIVVTKRRVSWYLQELQICPLLCLSECSPWLKAGIMSMARFHYLFCNL
jgi:hypothetical protein